MVYGGGGGGGYGYAKPSGSSDWAIRSQQMAFGQQEQANQYELAQGQAIGGAIGNAPRAFLEAQGMVQEMGIRAQTARANLLQEELRRRRLQQDIDMTDRLYQSDSMQLDVETRREQLRAMKLQNDMATQKYEEEQQFRQRGQNIDLMKVLSGAPAHARLDTGEIVIGDMAVKSDGTSRVLTAAESAEYSQRIQNLAKVDDKFLFEVRQSLPDDDAIRARFADLLVRGASREEYTKELSPMLQSFKPTPVKERPESTKFADSAVKLVDDLIKNQYQDNPLGGKELIGDPARVEAMQDIKRDIQRAQVRVQSNTEDKQAIQEAKDLIDRNLNGVLRSQESLDAYIFLNEASTNPTFSANFGLDKLPNASQEDADTFGDVALGLGSYLSSKIDKKQNEIFEASKGQTSEADAYRQARSEIQSYISNQIRGSESARATLYVSALKQQGYDSKALRQFVDKNFANLTETELRAALGETR